MKINSLNFSAINQKRIVVKIGSSSLTNKSGLLDQQRLFEYAEIISNAHLSGNEIILVSSGAVAAGLQPLGLHSRPELISELQAAASVGQAQLIWQWQRAFATNSISVGQVLLTRSEFEVNHVENVTQTIEKLLEMKAIPVINENDSVATDELIIGDNDQLAALVAANLNASRLIMLSDTNGLHTLPPTNPNAKLINTIRGISGIEEAEQTAVISGAGSIVGTGGMRTKLLAAKIALKANVNVTLTNADNIKNAINLNLEERLSQNNSTEFFND